MPRQKHLLQPWPRHLEPERIGEKVVETSVTNNSSNSHLDDHTKRAIGTPGYKPFYYTNEISVGQSQIMMSYPGYMVNYTITEILRAL